MSMTYRDPLDVLLGLQRALEARLESDWLRDATTSMGPFPPINIFQQGENFVAIIELPGIDKNGLQIQAKENIGVPRVHRLLDRERISGEFDRTLTVPVQIDPDGIKAEYRDGILALFIPTAERAKPRSIKIA